MKNGIRVLNVIIEDRVGGPQLRILQVAKKLKVLGIETIVAIPSNNGGFQRLLSREGIKFYEIKGFRRPRLTLTPAEHLKYILSFLPSIAQLRKIIYKESIDIVHQNDIKQIQGPISAKLANSKVIWHLQSFYPSFSSIFLPFPYFFADHIAVSSIAMAEAYFGEKRKPFKKPCYIIYPPVDINTFQPEIDPSAFKKEFHLTNAYPIIGTVGNINHIKGHEYFIRAAHIIKKKYKNAKFVIVGRILENRIRYFENLEKLADRLNLSQEDMIFTGARNDIPSVLCSFDVFVFPSLSESFGMALAEAMAMELPCVASNVGGIPEIVRHGETGLLVPPKDHRAIAEAVDHLLSNRAKAREMGKKARERVVSEFSLDKCVQKHYELYHALLQGKS